MAAQGGATKYDGMWASLFDEKEGFWGKYGPTTVARRETCFNRSQDLEECNWAGPSWPYETSRVLTGLSNFLTEYPAQQSKSAGMDAAHYTRLLRTYVRAQYLLIKLSPSSFLVLCLSEIAAGRPSR